MFVNALAVFPRNALYFVSLFLGGGPEVAVEDNRLKHRLIGATVLVALGVVFLPAWLDMRPAPGTRLEKSNIPVKPQWHFFASEKDEHQAIAPPPPPPVASVNAPTTPSPTAGAPAPAAGASAPTNPGGENQVASQAPSSAPSLPAVSPTPPAPPPTRTSVYTTKIGVGASLYSAFAKVNLGAAQVRELLRLGPSVKALEHVQTGRTLWIKTGPQQELAELIYYGPDHRVYAHVVRRGNHLQLADTASAARILHARESPEPSAREGEKRDLPPPPAANARHVAQEGDKRGGAPESQVTTRMSKNAHGAPTDPSANARPATPVKPVTVAKLPPRPLPAPTPKHTHTGAATAWVVQIASLNREENARVLQDSLSNKGFPVYLESLYEGGHKLWRVRVGPSTDRAEVDALRARLEREAHLPGQVLPYP